jgi:predicted unusual protein kinase regulating ubiquinone biosynthesis (AarF/ABC1/UbiB family)
MSANADDPLPDAGKLPTGRMARTARVGGLVTGQGLRWAGMRTANRVRTPERAANARNERTAALVEQLVEQLGQMRGAAMKVGQMISMVDFDGLEEGDRDELQRKLAALRDDIPPVPFADLEKLTRQELGGPLQRMFSDFDERAFAAASIGQVHRATTLDGDDVVVKVQYPGVAEAVETDLRNAMLLLPLVKRLAPGLDAKALAAELRERIAEELDYQLEAQNQRRVERLMRGHPFLRVPRVHTDLSTRRVLVSEYIAGERFESVRRAEEISATAMARPCSGSSSACSIATGSPSGTLIPVTISCARTAGSASWTSACCAMSTSPVWPVNERSPSRSATRTRRR